MRTGTAVRAEGLRPDLDGDPQRVPHDDQRPAHADGQPQVLPVSETLTGGGQTKEVTLSHWAERLGVSVPGSTVPCPLLVSRR